MKKTLKITIFILILSLVLPSLAAGCFPVEAAPRRDGKAEMRGVWVATVVNIDYPAKPTTDSEVLKREALKILDNAKDMGMNTVFLQVRPSSDALYKSKYFPWSKYLTGLQGMAPNNDFDPLEFWVAEAHNRGMELHAWLNPYRVTKKSASEPDYNTAGMSSMNPALQHPEWVVRHSDGNLYYNPGIPEVRQLVIDSALEIVNNYNVDGIHFDDYFYPGRNFNDDAAFAQYGSGYSSKDDWRRANVNTLVADLSAALKASGKNVRFGISPAGIWANKKSNALGSDTNGAESYNDHYADTRKWVKDGLLDYIAPQIYWNIGYKAADYSKLLTWWQNTVYGTNVDLYIGQAAYREGSSDSSSPWYGVAEIERQMALNAQSPEVKGSIFFSYKSLANYPALGSLIKTIYQQRDGVAPAIPVKIARSSKSIKTGYSTFYLTGSSDPSKPLYLNGKLVENRSMKGYFGVLVSLSKGDNTFAFTQDGSYDTVAIYRQSSASGAAKLSTATIPSASVFPQSQEYRSSGEKVTLSCEAPIGAKVTVKLGGKTYTMKPSKTKSPGKGLYSTNYTYSYMMPQYSGIPRVIDLGTPVYTMSYKGIVRTRKAPAHVGVIMKNAPIYAEVAKPVINAYEGPYTSEGGAYELYQGMVGNVTAMTGKYVRFFPGVWAFKSTVNIYTTPAVTEKLVNRADYLVGEKWDSLGLDLSSPALAIADFDGTVLKLSMSGVVNGFAPALPENSMFATVEYIQDAGTAYYKMTLKPNQRIEGYYVEKTASGINLNIKRPVKVLPGGAPLSGITIMVDPGHGGSSTGATGPLGKDYAEKDINLKISQKLQAELQRMGATVLMTRTTDVDVSLDERLDASRNAKPDLFISVHANAMDENIDVSKIQGISAFYRETFARSLTERLFNETTYNLARNQKGLRQTNFYVIRGTWSLSILMETGFVPNPNEFEWLTDENEQARLAENFAQSIARYYANN